MYKFDQKREREREREIFHTLILSKSESNLHGRTKKTRDLNAYAYDIHAYRQFTIFAIDKKKECGQIDVVKAFCW